jgi:hypothetical protein
MQLPGQSRSSQWRRDPLVDAEAEADVECEEVEVAEVTEEAAEVALALSDARGTPLLPTRMPPANKRRMARLQLRRRSLTCRLASQLRLVRFWRCSSAAPYAE